MKRALNVTALVAMGLLVAASFAAAQDAPATTSGGQVTIGALGVSNVASSKFNEYRDVPKGVAIPYVNVFSTSQKVDFNLQGYNVRQSDQQYTGWLTAGWFGVTFDYNQIPHNMGNDAKVIFTEVQPGVWTMNQALRLYNETTLVNTASTARTVPFYDALLAPTFAATNSYDISSLRKRGELAVDLGKDLPFDLTFTYMRERKSGYRGAEGGGVYSTISQVVEVPGPLDELTQDFGLRAAWNFPMGNVYASFNRNLYNNEAETLTVDNPFQSVDQVYASSVGGASRARWINMPDNEANRGAAGLLLKFAGQTRIGGNVAFAQFTQDAPFYPYTINSAILTPTGARADNVSSLQQSSLNGKINTTTLNFTFSSRPIPGLALRAQYRSYELTNKTSRFVITGDVGGSPDRTWSTVTASTDSPYGHATANVYDNSVKRFKASAGYDIGPLTLEAQVRTAKLTRTSREAESGKDTGVGMAAVFHANDWLGVRATYDQAKRTAEGHTLYGFQADEAERETKRAGVDVELSPLPGLGVTFAYNRRAVDYPNRPNRIAVASGAPIAGAVAIPDTPSGLIETKYDSYTGEIEFAPSERFEIGAYYTWEKDTQENRWTTTTSATAVPPLTYNNKMIYLGSDETNTFGANARIVFLPEKCTLTFNAMRQKVDGLMDITANDNGGVGLGQGTFYYPGRTTLIPVGQGGAKDITDWDDTELTTIGAQLDYTVAKSWTLSGGYMYEKYDFKDAYTSGTELMPFSILIFTKANNGAYDANVVYGKLTYKF